MLSKFHQISALMNYVQNLRIDPYANRNPYLMHHAFKNFSDLVMFQNSFYIQFDITEFVSHTPLNQ